jgi:hypothetical protein
VILGAVASQEQAGVPTVTREVPVAVPLPDLRPAAGQPRAGTAGANEQRIAEKKEAAKNRMRAKRKRDQDEKLAEHFEMDIDDVTELGADDRSAKVAAHNAWKDRAQWNKRLAAFSGRLTRSMVSPRVSVACLAHKRQGIKSKTQDIPPAPQPPLVAHRRP